jgi:hypothetical protein
MPNKKRDVAKEIREKSIRDNAAASKASAEAEAKKKKKKKRSSFAEALSDALDIFKVGRTVEKAAKR